MDIQKDLSAVINANLPAAVGAELQKVLAKGQEDANARVHLELQVTHLQQSLKTVQEALSEAEARLRDHRALDIRTVELDKRAAAMELDLLRHSLAQAQDNTKFARDVALGLVRNTEYRNSVFESQSSRQHVVPQGSFLNSDQGSSKTTTTTTSQV